MKRIIISTSIAKANECQREGETNFGNQINGLIDNLESKKIIKYDYTELYFLIDTYNGNENIGFQFDFENDILLYHNFTILNAQEFVNKFSNKKDSIHNDGNESLYRKIYLVLVDETIEDKYDAVFSILFPSSQTRSSFGNFNADLCNSKISLDEIKEKYPEITQLACFLEYATEIYPYGKNLFDTNNPAHLELYKELQNCINNPN